MQGRLTCTRCGKRFGGYTNRLQKPPRPYYQCLGQKREHAPDYEDKPCRWSLRANEVDALVWDEIKNLLKNPQLLLEGVRLEQAQAETELSPLRERMQLLDDMIGALDRQQSKHLDLYVTTDNLSKDDYQKRLAELERRREAFGAERADLGRRVTERTPDPGNTEAIDAFCAELARGIDSSIFEDKQQVLEILNVKGVVVRGEKRGEYRITLSGYFPKQVGPSEDEEHELVTTISGCSTSPSCPRSSSPTPCPPGRRGRDAASRETCQGKGPGIRGW